MYRRRKLTLNINNQSEKSYILHTNILEEIYQKTQNIEEKFKKKKILFIPSESYDGATITIIEGLNDLGFEILTYKKNNINSWFCNKIIDNLNNIEVEIDFVLSNLHWGTRWSLYKKLHHKVPYILIDGDDRIHGNERSNWLDKYNNYIRNYRVNPPEEIKNMELAPYRWMEKMEDYKPDIVFMSQKYNQNKDEIYLPFGINKSYIKQNIKISKDRNYDICHIPGPGEYRKNMKIFINRFKSNYKVFNDQTNRNEIENNSIKDYIKRDNNIHSWHRWKINKDYFDVLNNSKITIYPGIDKPNAPGWDSKRPWEILSNGSLILFTKPPNFDNSSYPLENLCKNIFYKDNKDLTNKLDYLLKDLVVLEEIRNKYYIDGIKYFNPKQISRYFLYNI